MGDYTRGMYHGNMPTWRNGRNQEAGQLVGFELEIENPNGYLSTLEALPDNTRRKPIAEQDGSLNHRLGVEIVFPPYKYSAIKRKGAFFERAMSALEEAGCHAGLNCGLHMNINTNGWGEELRKIFTAVVNSFSAEQLANVGGRRLNGFCQQVLDQIDVTYTGSRNSHHCLVSVRDNRLELRFPAATTDMRRYKTLVDFVDLVEKYSRTLIGRVTDDMVLYRELRHNRNLKKFSVWLDEQKQTKRVKNLKQVLEHGYQ